MRNLNKFNFFGEECRFAGDELDQKANTSGVYDDMTVGNAKQLSGTVFVDDQEPYLYRTAGGSIDIGDREYDEIVGGTVAWNQLSNQPTALTKTFSSDASDYFGALGTLASEITIISGHKYFCGADVERTISQNNGVAITFADIAGAPFVMVANGSSNGWHYAVFDATSNKNGAILGYNNYLGKHGFNAGDSITVNNSMFIDLTSLFGSTIADYIYSLEQATAGAGVAWFRKYFPKDYYSYSEPTLKSVEGLTAHEMVGFNAFDKSTATGGKSINADGEVVSGSYYVSDFIRIVSNAVYYVKDIVAATNGRGIATYDGDKKFINILVPNNAASAKSGAVTMPSNSVYARLLTDTPDTCVLNLSWDGERDGEYEPYVQHSYPLDSTWVGMGIPKIADGKLYFDGDRYASDGTVTVKYGIVDLGTLTWETAGSGRHNATISEMLSPGNTQIADIICAKYVTVKGNDIASNDKAICAINTQHQIQINDSTYNGQSASEFKTAMSGVYLVYEKATPTTSTATPFTSPQIVDDFGTEEYVTDSIVPVGHNTKYASNLRAKLEMAPESPSGNGDYIVRQSNGTNTYVPLVIPTELPSMPADDGTYVLKATKSGTTVGLAWVADE